MTDQNALIYKPLAKTWTGWIIFVNTAVFVIMAASGSNFFSEILSPSPQILLKFGAKDLVGLAHGDFWRLFNPIFIHIGMIHFLINNAGLRVVGRVIEQQLGTVAFLSIYVGSGILGNACSALSNSALGAGASGAIFGLIGTGVYFEFLLQARMANTKFKIVPGPFTFTALLNFGLAIALNTIFGLSDSISVGIDNAAHLGGLVGGLLGASILVSSHEVKSKHAKKPRRRAISTLKAILAVSLAVGMIVISLDPIRLRESYLDEAKQQEPIVAFSRFSRWLSYSPEDDEVLFYRGSLLLKNHEFARASLDLITPVKNPELKWLVDDLFEDLSKAEDHLALKVLASLQDH